MAQIFPTSAKVIYDTLTADATFMAYLGTYDFQQGLGPTTAISIVSPGESLPELRSVEGLECVIQDSGDIDRKDYVAGDSDFSVKWRVFLICWDDDKGSDMTSAALRVLQMFGSSSATETVAATNGIGALAQTMITIRSDRPILV